jgi:hypothetical protein
VFGLPKNDEERQTPLPESVARVVKPHHDQFPAVPVTLPRQDSASRDLVTVRLLFTGLRVRRWTEWTSTSECGVRPWPVRASAYRYAHLRHFQSGPGTPLTICSTVRTG